MVPCIVAPHGPLTKTAYCDAALEILAHGGPEALSLAALCERVGATKGSFYHHFDSLGELHTEMLSHWATAARRRNAVQIPDDPHERLSMLRHLAVEANHETEVAVRAWATWYEPAAVAVRTVERRRREMLCETFVDLGIEESHAATLAVVGTTLMAGVQNDVEKVDRSLLDEVLTEYQRWIEASLP